MYVDACTQTDWEMLDLEIEFYSELAGCNMMSYNYHLSPEP